ncbi:hypothetical protein ACH5RR_010035 [Cinchona calisaya]|uniref:Uncharacterized protein n=1 Tax=Cinchona calisaya TaxID=153742 RepID=A0ABD3AGM9_9GENT
MKALGAYRQVSLNDPVVGCGSHSNHSSETAQPFVSLWEIVSEIISGPVSKDFADKFLGEPSEILPSLIAERCIASISTFVKVSPARRDSVWTYLEQYDLPVVVGPQVGNSVQLMSRQIGMLDSLASSDLFVIACLDHFHRMPIQILVLGLLAVVQFKSPEKTLKSSLAISNIKYDFMAKDILSNAYATGKGGVYYYSERGDHLIDLSSFCD